MQIRCFQEKNEHHLLPDILRHTYQTHLAYMARIIHQRCVDLLICWFNFFLLPIRRRLTVWKADHAEEEPCLPLLVPGQASSVVAVLPYFM